MAEVSNPKKKKLIQSLDIVNLELEDIINQQKEYKNSEQYIIDQQAMEAEEEFEKEHGHYNFPPALYAEAAIERMRRFKPNPERFDVFEKIIEFINNITEFYGGEIFLNPLSDDYDENLITYDGSVTTVCVAFSIPELQIEKRENPVRDYFDDEKTLWGRRIYDTLSFIFDSACSIGIEGYKEGEVVIRLFFDDIYLDDGLHLSKQDQENLEAAIQRGEIDLSSNEEDEE